MIMNINIIRSINNTCIELSPKEGAAEAANKLQKAGINILEIKYQYAGDKATILAYTACSDDTIKKVINSQISEKILIQNSFNVARKPPLSAVYNF